MARVDWYRMGVDTRARILSFVRAYFAEHGEGPTMQEIADGVGLGTRAGAWRQVRKLVEMGELSTVGGRRGVRPKGV